MEKQSKVKSWKERERLYAEGTEKRGFVNEE
jgi:hypothetical protein